MAEQHHTITADAAQNSKVDRIKIITDEPFFEDALLILKTIVRSWQR
jgi:hypothetical protein